MKHQQPEEIVYLPAEIAVKQNFDIEQEFDLPGTYRNKESDKRIIYETSFVIDIFVRLEWGTLFSDLSLYQ
ncbi:MAG: hypothetical protein V8S95_00565 [Odoribacter sp.]